MAFFWPFKQKKRVFATIDLGSNAVRFMVVKYKKSTGEYYSFDKVRRALRLGLDVFDCGEISPTTMDRSVVTFKEFKSLLDNYGVSKYRAVATSALRESKNQKEFVDRISRESGINLEVINGMEEAKLISEAIGKVVDTSRGKSLLLDIGGGSLELTFINWGQEEFRHSFPMGTLRTLEKIKAQGLEKVKASYRELLSPLAKITSDFGGVDLLLGTGGNVSRFASILGEITKTGNSTKELGLIRRERLQVLSEKFLKLGSEGIMQEFALTRDRADVAYPASMVLGLVMDIFNVDKMSVPFVELSDGLIHSMIDDYLKTKYEKGRKKVRENFKQTQSLFLDIEKRAEGSLIRQFIYEVPDFPKPGIMFKDVTPLFENPLAFKSLTHSLAEAFKASGAKKIIGIDARGFIVGTSIAQHLGIPLVLARKPGKLPRKTVKKEYELEYGSSSLEITQDSLHPGDKVFIVDDLLATGGTVDACKSICESMGAIVVGIGFIIELTFIPGREKLKDIPVVSLVKY